LASHKVNFLPSNKNVEVQTGSLVSEAIIAAELEIQQPCGGQGRCGRCAVFLEDGQARRRSTIRLSERDLQEGLALACQTIVEGDLSVRIPEQARIERRLVTEHSAREIELPFEYDPESMQSLQCLQLQLDPPSLDDQIDDFTRFAHGLKTAGYIEPEIPLPVLQKLGSVLRDAEWAPWVLLDRGGKESSSTQIIDLKSDPFQRTGLALDIGTTTVTAYLIDLETGNLLGSAAEYNGQIARGEDVISRIIYSGKGTGLPELGALVRETVDVLLARLQKRTGIHPEAIHKATVAGNTTMIHLFLQIPPESIRLAPYIPAVNFPHRYRANELDLAIHPQGIVDCLPGVASYVGADISSGVLASGLFEAGDLTLFLDVGTNGETVLGTQDWMLTCACSAGPAFEGAGVVHGMRATQGAIEEVWIHSETFEPTFRVIAGTKPMGICGSGLISLLSELFVTGVIDRAGNFKLDLGTSRVREGEHGPEFVLAWGSETDHGKDIVLTKVDVDNLLRAKAAIYAGFTVLAENIGVDLADVQQVLIGGAFGKYINVENAITIGLLPDLPWERFHFLGNTSVLGAYWGLVSSEARDSIQAIAQKLTYVELSADNTFYDAFTAAMFLPHTDITRFPSVQEVWQRENGQEKNR
jgi:uncharacterized 2Fe-2S/4Fe-4S cluster protein (DUF4445 family)